MSTSPEHTKLLSSTKLSDDSFGQVGAFLNRLSDRGVQIGTLHAIRSENVLADTLATLMQRLAGEYFIIRSFRRMIRESHNRWLEASNPDSRDVVWYGRVLMQHYGVGTIGGDLMTQMFHPCAVAVCDMSVAIHEPQRSQMEIEGCIRSFQNDGDYPDSLDDLRSRCYQYQEMWGMDEGMEFLSPIYVPGKLSGVKQLNPRLTVLKSEFYTSLHIEPKLTVD